MKILVVEGDIYNSIAGFRKNLITKLQEDHDVFIAGSIAYEAQMTAKLVDGNKMFVLGKLNKSYIGSIRYFFKLLAILYKINPDICLSYNFRPNFFLGLCLFFKNFYTIATITGTGVLFEKNVYKVKVLRFFYKFLLRRFDAVFIQNQSDYNEFLANGFKFKRCKVIPGSGVDLNKFNPSLVNKKFSEAGFAKFIFIARLVKEKGFFEYVEAAKRIKNDYLGAEFFVLGPFYKGGYTNGIDENTVLKLNAENVIKYLGETKDVTSFIIDKDCIVLPSYREGISNTLMEGAALGKPIIATDVPGCKELIDVNENGYLCKPRDVNDLEDKMRLFLLTSSEARKKMGAHGRKKMEKFFNRENVILEYCTLIKEEQQRNANPRNI